MAAQTMVSDMNLRLVLNTGTSPSGKAIMKNKVYKFVKMDAPADKVLTVATALASLQGFSLEGIQTISTADVIQM
ncbi:DUF1659 domain-containing protein [Ectobacillus polymachus]|uniref:DUF1659 domain-containing protein n=1 Tax=Ectobacillus polymachus TaxID=1508806 RepID=UPI003A862D4F